MKNNRYTRAVGGVRATEEFKERVLETAAETPARFADVPVKKARFFVKWGVVGVAFLAVVMLAVIFVPGLLGRGFAIEQYKQNATAELDVYIADLNVSNYTPEEWEAVLVVLTGGKAAIDAATDKAGVDNAVLATKKSILVEVEVDDMVDCSKFFYFVGRSWTGYPITLDYANENAVFICTVETGVFGWRPPSDEARRVEVKPGNGFWWNPVGIAEVKPVYVNIILKLDNTILGYALIELYPSDANGFSFFARTVKSALFPKIDGEYQNITEPQVNMLINKAKAGVGLERE